jgi:kanamycin kinase
VPAVVGLIAVGRSAHAVWVNEQGRVTFRVDCGISGRELIKVANTNTADFTDEARRLRWAARYVAVPQVLGVGLDEAQTETGPGYTLAACRAFPRYTRAG